MLMWKENRALLKKTEVLRGKEARGEDRGVQGMRRRGEETGKTGEGVGPERVEAGRAGRLETQTDRVKNEAGGRTQEGQKALGNTNAGS